MDFSKITTVFIDIDDTLLDFDRCAESAMRKAAEFFGIELPENPLDVFLPVNDDLWKKIEEGALTVEGLHKIRWALVFAAMNVKFDGVTFEKKFLEILHHTAVKVEGAEELMRFLSARFKVYGATNAVESQQIVRLKAAGLYKYFSGLFVSEAIGYAKPQPEFFAACLKNVAAENALMIGDSYRADISGAVKAGMKTIWFNKKKKDTDGVLCDKIVYSLDEIASLFG